MIVKNDNKLTNFEKKLFFTINNGHNGYKFIIDYINDKTYGSFRTVSKNIKETTKELLNRKLITKNEYDKIFETIRNKSKTKKPTIKFNLEKFYGHYCTLERNNNELLDALFLSLPFLYITNFKELSKIKISKIDIFEVKTGIVIRWYDNENQINSLVIEKYDDLWLKKFKKLRESSTNDFLFNKFFSSNTVQAYTQLNLDFHELLKDFVPENSSKLKYITEIKNALKYSTNSIFKTI